MTVLRLDIEPIPTSTWGNNIRNLIGKKEWGKLRKKIIADFRHTCGICCTKSVKLHCHEIWKFDDKKHIQYLTGFIPLCKMCHAVKHLGYAGIQADRGELNWEKLIRHFMNVNKCNKNTFEKHQKLAERKWVERSKYAWEVYIKDINLSLI